VTVVETVTTIVMYAVLDPHDPSQLRTKVYYATMDFSSCNRCQNGEAPEREWAFFVTSCNACGPHGESTVTLGSPVGAWNVEATGLADDEDDGNDEDEDEDEDLSCDVEWD
jgi:hypothetical protein